MSDFGHLRELPDGSLSSCEVGILIDEIEKLRGALGELCAWYPDDPHFLSRINQALEVTEDE